MRRMKIIVLSSLLGILGCAPNAGEPEILDFVLPAPVVDAGMLFRGTFSPSGTEFYYFAKVNAGNEDYRVYRMDRTESGWSQASLMALGDSTASSMYPAISPDNQLLVFTSYRSSDGEATNANLWLARRTGSGWSPPRPLEQASTADQYDAGPWFGSDGDLRFASTSADWRQTWMRKAPRVGETFGAWSEDTVWSDFDVPLETHHFWSGITNRAGTIAILELSEREPEGTLGDSDLWVSRFLEGAWSPAEPLGDDVNSDGTENFATFAPDDVTLVFVRDFAQFRSVVLDP